MLIFRGFEYGENGGGKNQKKPYISWNYIKQIHLHTNSEIYISFYKIQKIYLKIP